MVFYICGGLYGYKRVYIYRYMNTYAFIYMNTKIYTYVYIYMRVWVCVCACVCECVCIFWHKDSSLRTPSLLYKQTPLSFSAFPPPSLSLSLSHTHTKRVITETRNGTLHLRVRSHMSTSMGSQVSFFCFRFFFSSQHVHVVFAKCVSLVVLRLVLRLKM